MDKETAELLSERHRLVGYDLAHSVALVDAELARKGLNPDGSEVGKAKDEKASDAKSAPSKASKANQDAEDEAKNVPPVERQAPKRAKA